MTLNSYERKRKFTGRSRTPEPRKGGRRNSKPIFVVQLHHASHRHYDFRLEHAGTLKSWAIPKGPSLDPKVKRLAVEVEDHPISYASFEGDIPQGHYGAGHVDIFDQGIWTSEPDIDRQLAKGHLHFHLQGRLLKGAWDLVRTGRKARQPEWLLIKVADEYAAAISADELLDTRPEEPRHARRSNPETAAVFSPELCRVAEKPPAGDGWLHEIKWDGYRLLASISRGKVRLWSRNAVEWTDRIPEVAAALRKLKLKSAEIDGELVVFDAERSSFNALKARLAGENSLPLSYVMFDLPSLEGRALAERPLLERKQALQRLLNAHPQAALRYSDHVIGGGASVFRQAIANGLEGVISKRIDSRYEAGRVGDWVKSKGRTTDEFLIIGYTAPKGSRSGLGALLLGKPEKSGLRYAGRCGSGFDAGLLRQLRTSLDRLKAAKPAADVSTLEPRVRSTVQWVKPEMVVEAYYAGVGGQGLLRHPVFKAVREDKSAAELISTAAVAAPTKNESARGGKRASASDAAVEVVITHAQRIMFPDLGTSKAEIADYYRSVMPSLLPGIVGRPLSVVRCPDGIGGETFFQKHVGKGWGPHIAGVALDKKKSAADYLYVTDAAGVLELVQMNVIEFHPWGATVADPEHADRIVFDLDPDRAVTWKRTVKAAQDLRAMLDGVGLQSFVRTTGGKGLHVVVPLRPAAPWKQAKDFAHSVARVITQAAPEAYTDVAAKSRRRNRIFIDWLRNGRGATSVASYSLRARPGAKVAMPLAWSELARLKSGDSFDLSKALRRLRRRPADPWSELPSVEQSLAGLQQRLHKV